MTREQIQLAKWRNGNRARPRGFTLAELLVVILIIAILAALSTSAYLGVFRSSQERRAKVTLDTVSAAVQAFYNENRDYPSMRFGDTPYLDSLTLKPSVTGAQLPAVAHSVAAMIYCLQYRSSAGDLLKNMPASVLKPLVLNGVSWSVIDGGETRQLYMICDSWGWPIQYLRPRPVSDPTDPLSGQSLNYRVLLVSMGKDGKPGVEGVNDEDPTKTTNPDVWTDTTMPAGIENVIPDPRELVLGKGDDILVQVGSAR